MKLRHFKKINNLKNAGIAEDLGVTESMISLIVSEKRPAGPKLALRIEKWSKGEVTLRESLFPELFE